MFNVFFFFIPKTHFYNMQSIFNLDTISNEKNKDYNKKWSNRMLIIGPSGSGKTNPLFNLIKEQDSDDLTNKIYLYAKDFVNHNISF